MTDEKDIITEEETGGETVESVEDGKTAEAGAKENLRSDVHVDSRELAEKIVRVLAGRKAADIALLKIDEQTVLTDYFVICTGNSNTQIKGIYGEVEKKIGEAYGLGPRSVEGWDDAKWILVDYGNVIVHIFNREMRDFYNLEKLWAEGTEEDISGIIKEELGLKEKEAQDARKAD